MGKLTKEEIEAFTAGQPVQFAVEAEVRKRIAPGDDSEYDPPFPENPDNLNVFRMLGNAPYSGLQAMIDLGGAVSHPIDTAKMGLSALMGSGDEAGRQFLGTPDTRDAQTFRLIGEYALDRYGGLGNINKTLTEDPIGALLDLSMVGGATGRLGKLGKVSQAAQSINPIRAAGEAARLTGQAPKGLRKLLQGVESFATGFPPATFEQAFQSGVKGGATQAAFKAALREKQFGEHILRDVVDAVEDLKKARSLEYKAQMPSLVFKEGKSFNLNQIKTDVLAQVVDFKIKPKFKLVPEGGTIKDQYLGLDFSQSTIAKKGEQGRISNVIKDVMSWTDDSPLGLDTLKQRMTNFKDTQGGLPTANAFIDAAHGVIRGELGKKVKGYDEVMKKYEMASEQLKDLKNTLSLESGNKETAISKISSILREPSNFDLRRRLVQDLERASGKPLSASIAGLELSQWWPKGLIGRGAAVGAASMAGGTELLALIPMTMPRVAGEFMSALGVGKKQVNTYTRFIQDLHKAMPTDMIYEGLSVGAVLERVVQQSPPLEEEKLLPKKDSPARRILGMPGVLGP